MKKKLITIITILTAITLLFITNSLPIKAFNPFQNNDEGYFQKIDSDFPVYGNPIKLKDGRVLITARPDNIIFDPKTKKFRKTAPFNNDIEPGIGVLLNNGKVLFVGPITLKQPSEKFTKEIYEGLFIKPYLDRRFPNKNTDYMNYRKLPEEEKKKIYMPFLEKNPELMKKYNEDLKTYEDSMSAQLYNPDTEKFEYSGKLNIRRNGTKNTLLKDGRVFIIDPYNVSTYPEIYDPITSKFTLTTKLESFKYINELITLNDGRIFILGCGNYTIYDPVKNSYSEPKPFENKYKKLLKLKDGRILIFTGDNSVFNAYKVNNPPENLTGGTNANVYMYTWQQFNAMGIKIYDPVKDEISVAGHLAIPRGEGIFTPVILKDGRVLITGGQKDIEKHKLGDRIKTMAEAEIFDPNIGKSKLIKNMNYMRAGDKSVLLDDGRVLLYGGNEGFDIELYIPKDFKN